MLFVLFDKVDALVVGQSNYLFGPVKLFLWPSQKKLYPCQRFLCAGYYDTPRDSKT